MCKVPFFPEVKSSEDVSHFEEAFTLAPIEDVLREKFTRSHASEYYKGLLSETKL
jgi:hypothetical protein